MATAAYSVGEFVREAERIADRGDSAERTIAALASPLERIIARRDCLADLPGRDDPDPDEGFVIHRSEHLTVLAVVWQPGRGALVHNHNGWAMEGVISGVEFNRNYERVDDGAQPWIAELEEQAPSRVAAGETTVIAQPPSDIHAVEISEGKTLAIHLYGLDLLKQWRYTFDLETGEVSPFRMRTRKPA